MANRAPGHPDRSQLLQNVEAQIRRLQEERVLPAKFWQKELIRLLGYDKGTVSRLVNYGRGSPHLLIAFCRIAGITLDTLVAGIDAKYDALARNFSQGHYRDAERSDTSEPIDELLRRLGVGEGMDDTDRVDAMLKLAEAARRVGFSERVFRAMLRDIAGGGKAPERGRLQLKTKTHRRGG